MPALGGGRGGKPIKILIKAITPQTINIHEFTSIIHYPRDFPCTLALRRDILNLRVTITGTPFPSPKPPLFFRQRPGIFFAMTWKQSPPSTLESNIIRSWDKPGLPTMFLFFHRKRPGDRITARKKLVSHREHARIYRVGENPRIF